MIQREVQLRPGAALEFSTWDVAHPRVQQPPPTSMLLCTHDARREVHGREVAHAALLEGALALAAAAELDPSALLLAASGAGSSTLVLERGKQAPLRRPCDSRPASESKLRSSTAPPRRREQPGSTDHDLRRPRWRAVRLSRQHFQPAEARCGGPRSCRRAARATSRAAGAAAGGRGSSRSNRSTPRSTWAGKHAFPHVDYSTRAACACGLLRPSGCSHAKLMALGGCHA